MKKLKFYADIVLNVLVNAINIIFAFIFNWDFSIVVVALFVQNIIHMVFISLRCHRLFGKYYTKFDSRAKAWSPEYSSSNGLIVMLWLAFSLGHFLIYLALQDENLFYLARISRQAHLLVLSCSGYLAYQIYFYCVRQPPLEIKGFKIDGVSTQVVIINSNRFIKSALQGILYFLPLFFMVIVLQEHSSMWLPGLLCIVIIIELFSQLIEHNKKEFFV